MRNKMAILGTILTIMATGDMLFGELANKGFEETVKAPEKIYEGAEKKNFKIEKPSYLPANWILNLGTRNSRDGEYRMISDSSLAHSGDRFIYLKGRMYNSKVITVKPGDTLQITIYARDPDKKDVFCELYMYRDADEKGSTYMGTKSVDMLSPEFSTRAKAEWTKHTGSISIPEKVRGSVITDVRIVLASDTGAYFDDVELEIKKAE